MIINFPRGEWILTVEDESLVSAKPVVEGT
jgi:hypothetical protein